MISSLDGQAASADAVNDTITPEASHNGRDGQGQEGSTDQEGGGLVAPEEAVVCTGGEQGQEIRDGHLATQTNKPADTHRTNIVSLLSCMAVRMAVHSEAKKPPGATTRPAL